MNIRLNKLRAKLANEKIDAILITAPENRLYLSGFTGSAAVLFISSTEAFLLTDFRYTEQASQQSPHLQIIKIGKSIEETLIELINNSGAKRIGLEEEDVTYSRFRQYQEKIDYVVWVPVKNMVEDLRKVKDQTEQENLKKAIYLADEAFAHIIKKLQPGSVEKEIALEMEYFMRRNGAEKAAFDFIVASGERSSMPHGVASSKTINRGELVTMDFGCVVNGYHSDITRTVVVGAANDKQREIYKIVLQAQQEAIAAVKPGVKGSSVDKVARDIIAGYGYGDNFGHGLGHSVGLQIHENPSFSTKDDTILETGMTITVEPGIYLPGWGGVRIEDIVLVTDAGCAVLTGADKKLLEL